MTGIIMGLLGFVLFFLYDVNSVLWKKKALHGFFTAGCLLITAGTVYMAVRSWGEDGIAGGFGYCMAVLGILNFCLLVYTLFFALPFEKTYLSAPDAQNAGDGSSKRAGVDEVFECVEEKSDVCDRGVYALCRHPGVLWFFFFFLFCGLAMPSGLFLTGGMIFSVCNLGYVIFQDIWTFPETFTNYNIYKKKTPFLLPTGESIRACIRTLGRGGR